MREVEIKVRIASVKNIQEMLQKLGCAFTPPVYQQDKIFLPGGINFENRPLGTNVLRIRKQENSTLFTLKQPIANELDCIEHELKIDDSDEMESILTLLGYKKAVEVNKIRIRCILEDYSICLDEVEALGSFIEVECLVDEDVKDTEIQNTLLLFLRNLGIEDLDRVHIGYDTMMYNLTHFK